MMTTTRRRVEELAFQPANRCIKGQTRATLFRPAVPLATRLGPAYLPERNVIRGSALMTI
jgi:hypothetical protein